MQTATEDWTSPGIYEVTEGVYQVPLPLPNDGLRRLLAPMDSTGTDTR
jgi:hypothetical protein